MYYFDLKSSGFYHDEINKDIPETAVKISDDDYLKLRNGLNEGKTIIQQDGQLKLIDPKPSQYHELKEGLWTISPENELKLKQGLIQEHSNSIDATASNIASHWTRFADEYYEREGAAKAFAQANFEGEPGIWITGFAQPAGLDNKTATQLILKQAEQLKSMLSQLGALRMRKYELKRPSLNAEQLQAIHDDIISKMTALAEAMV